MINYDLSAVQLFGGYRNEIVWKQSEPVSTSIVSHSRFVFKYVVYPKINWYIMNTSTFIIHSLNVFSTMCQIFKNKYEEFNRIYMKSVLSCKQSA